MDLKLLHLASKEPVTQIWTPRFIEHLEHLGRLRLESQTADWTDDQVADVVREHDILITNWGSRRLPEILADAPGRLRYICNLTGEIRPFVPRRFVEKGIPVTNWGSQPAFRVAEAALCLLLASLKELIPQQQAIRSGQWNPPLPRRGSMKGLRVGLFGLGGIGRAFCRFAGALHARLAAFDPYAGDWPDGIQKVDTLTELFSGVEAVVLTAALTGETRNSVNADLLARLPDGGIIINVARGALIDQVALFRELESGRLRAGLDVLDTDGFDWVPPGHPARQWNNLILTGHKAASSPWNGLLDTADGLSPLQAGGLDNIKRFVANQSLHNLFDLDRYDRST